jgi:spectinomycin phosphotransferase
MLAVCSLRTPSDVPAPSVVAMLTPAPGLTPEIVVEWVEVHWGLTGCRAAYLPAGAGSHNWVVSGDAGTWFVKIDPAGPDSEFFDATYATAAALADAGLDMVLGPVRDREGAPRRRVSADWQVAVFPYVRGRNATRAVSDRVRVARAIGRLHSSEFVPPEALRWTPGWLQPQLTQRLDQGLDRRWDQGPFGERARALLLNDRPGILRLLDLSAGHAAQLEQSRDRWVMTHGEPNSGNVMIDAAGRVVLIDCNGMLLAPPERDLRVLLYGHNGVERPGMAKVVAGYLSLAGDARPRLFVMELFVAEWHLAEIERYAQQFLGPHQDSDDARAAWTALTGYVPVRQNWPQLA